MTKVPWAEGLRGVEGARGRGDGQRRAGWRRPASQTRVSWLDQHLQRLAPGHQVQRLADSAETHAMRDEGRRARWCRTRAAPPRAGSGPACGGRRRAASAPRSAPAACRALIVVPGAQPPKNTTLPPRPTASTACSQTSGRPVASMVTSAPRPAVAARRSATTSARRGGVEHSPSPRPRTRSSRQPRLPTMITRALRAAATIASRQPSGPWPNTTTVWPASTRARSTPSSAQASGSAKAARAAGRGRPQRHDVAGDQPGAAARCTRRRRR